jgi:hypothetical protein
MTTIRATRLAPAALAAVAVGVALHVAIAIAAP